MCAYLDPQRNHPDGRIPNPPSLTYPAAGIVMFWRTVNVAIAWIHCLEPKLRKAKLLQPQIINTPG